LLQGFTLNATQNTTANTILGLGKQSEGIVSLILRFGFNGPSLSLALVKLWIQIVLNIPYKSNFIVFLSEFKTEAISERTVKLLWGRVVQSAEGRA